MPAERSAGERNQRDINKAKGACCHAYGVSGVTGPVDLLVLGQNLRQISLSCDVAALRVPFVDNRHVALGNRPAKMLVHIEDGRTLATKHWELEMLQLTFDHLDAIYIDTVGPIAPGWTTELAQIAVVHAWEKSTPKSRELINEPCSQTGWRTNISRVNLLT